MFSLSWFTSIPGILITVGVLLLVAALIIFIVTSQKNKKKEQGNDQNVASMQVADPSLVAPSPTITPVSMDNGNQTVNQAVQVQPVAQIPAGTNMAPSPYSSTTSDNGAVITPIDNSMQNLDALNSMGSSVYQNSSQVSAMPEQPYSQPSVTPEIVMPSPEIPTIAPSQDIVSNPVSMEVSTEPMMGQNSIPQIDTPVMQSVETIPTLENVSINANDNVANVGVTESIVPTVPDIAPVLAVQTDIVSSPVAPEVVAPVIPTVEVAPQQTPVISSEAPASTPTLDNNTVSPVQQKVVATPDVSAPIYGGVSPIVPDVSASQVIPQIYGGANPLENTQSVPISQIADDINQVNNTSVSNDGISQNIVDTPTPQVQPTSVSSAMPSSVQQEVSVNVPQTTNTVVQPTSVPMQDNLGAVPVENNVVYQAPVSNQQAVAISPNVQ